MEPADAPAQPKAIAAAITSADKAAPRRKILQDFHVKESCRCNIDWSFLPVRTTVKGSRTEGGAWGEDAELNEAIWNTAISRRRRRQRFCL